MKAVVIKSVLVLMSAIALLNDAVVLQGIRAEYSPASVPDRKNLPQIK
jgi:hypothetical protein